MVKVTKQTTKDLRNLSVEALRKEVETSSQKLVQLRSELSIGKLTNHSAIHNLRKDIARTNTVIAQKIILKETLG